MNTIKKLFRVYELFIELNRHLKWWKEAVKKEGYVFPERHYFKNDEDYLMFKTYLFSYYEKRYNLDLVKKYVPESGMFYCVIFKG